MNKLWQRLMVLSPTQVGSALARFWRRSLQFRTVVISTSLTILAIVVVGVYMSVSISNDLFSSRLSQVLNESQRAQAAAQRVLDTSEATDRIRAQSVMNAARTAIRDATSSPYIAVFRVPGQDPSAIAPQDFSSPELTGGVISPTLREQVQGDSSGQYWQSVSLTTSADRAPGVVVGSQLSLPGGGSYELYIGYDFSQAESTLAFVQSVLWVSGLVLLLLSGGVAYFVSRLLVRPIQVAADTSEKLSQGDLDVRIPERGEDVMSTLSKSFNSMASNMQRQLTELAELSSIQQRFVADVSHELRTPLTTIRLASDHLYLHREELTRDNRRSAELLQAQLDRFESLLADLLEISRYDARSIELQTESVNVAALVSDVVGNMMALAMEHKCEVSVTSPGGHFDIDVDPRRIRRILTNLIGNAIEHGSGKPIEVTVDSSESAVAVSVRDHGVGMSPEQAAQVFGRFWRADSARKRTIGGTGLGLAISLEDARVHGGRIDVWAAENEGANFVLTLPRVPDTDITELPLEPNEGFES
jgi:two-component system, OmpR family, sensor histidine kinase MtrB